MDIPEKRDPGPWEDPGSMTQDSIFCSDFPMGPTVESTE